MHSAFLKLLIGGVVVRSVKTTGEISLVYVFLPNFSTLLDISLQRRGGYSCY